MDSNVLFSSLLFFSLIVDSHLALMLSSNHLIKLQCSTSADISCWVNCLSSVYIVNMCGFDTTFALIAFVLTDPQSRIYVLKWTTAWFVILVWNVWTKTEKKSFLNCEMTEYHVCFELGGEATKNQWVFFAFPIKLQMWFVPCTHGTNHLFNRFLYKFVFRGEKCEYLRFAVNIRSLCAITVNCFSRLLISISTRDDGGCCWMYQLPIG